MKFHSDDIRKYQSKLDNFLLENTLNEVAGKANIAKSSELDSMFDQIIKYIPTLIISEKTGDPTSAERAQFDNYLKGFSGRGTVIDKLENIVNKLSLVSDIPPETDISEIIKRLIFFKTITNVFSSYNPQSSGFLMESLLSALFGPKGKQISIDASKSDVKNKIVDIKFGSESFGVKALQHNGDVKGSKTDLIAHFASETNQNPKITYIIIEKPQEGGLDYLNFYTFDITKENLKTFTSKYTPSKDIKPKKLYTKPTLMKEDTETQFSFSVVTLKNLNGVVLKSLGKLQFDQKIMETHYKNYIKSIKENIVPIYEALDMFSTNLLIYFASKNKDEREIKAVDVINSAEFIPKKVSAAKLKKI